MTWATWVCEYEHKKVESRMSKVYTQLCINYSSSSETILMYNSVQTTVHCTRCQSLKKCTNKHKRYVISRLCNICTVLLALANWNSARYMKWTGMYTVHCTVYHRKDMTFAILPELKTLEWDILNHDCLIWVSNVHTFGFLLNPLFWIPLLYKSYVW